MGLPRWTWALLFLVFLSSWMAAASLSNLKTDYDNGNGLVMPKVLQKYEANKFRDHLEESQGLETRLKVAPGDHPFWYIDDPNSNNHLDNNRVRDSVRNAGTKIVSFNVNGQGQLQKISLSPQSDKGFVFKLSESNNPFFLLVFIRFGKIRVSSNGVGSFLDLPATAPEPGYEKYLLKFTYVCFDDGKTSQCASTPPDLNGGVKIKSWDFGNPIQRVYPVSAWNLDDPHLADLLTQSDLYLSKPVSTGPVATPTSSTKLNLVFYQRTTIPPADLVSISSMGFTGVIFQVMGQSRNGDPDRFASTLLSMKNQNLPLLGYAWLNNLADNQYVRKLQSSPFSKPFYIPFASRTYAPFIFAQKSPVVFCKTQSGNQQLCMDDANTVRTLGDFYDAYFPVLSGQLNGQDVRKYFGGLVLDYESPAKDCTCGTFSSEAVRLKNRNDLLTGLLTRMSRSIKANFGTQIDTFFTAEDIGPTCSPTSMPISPLYTDVSSQFQFIPSPYSPADFSPDSKNKVAINLEACFRKANSVLFPLFVYQDLPDSPQTPSIQCQSKSAVDAAFRYVAKTSIYKGMASFEYNEWLSVCSKVCPDFVNGCKQSGNMGTVAQKAKTTQRIASASNPTSSPVIPTPSTRTIQYRVQYPFERIAQADLQSIARQGFNLVSFDLASDRSNGLGIPEFIDSLVRMHDVDQKTGSQLYAGATVFQVEKNDGLSTYLASFHHSGGIDTTIRNLRYCTMYIAGQGAQNRLCIDSPGTRQVLLAYYSKLFSDLKTAMDQKGVAYLLKSVSFDTELASTCQCGQPSKRAESWVSFYQPLVSMIHTTLGNDVKIYINGAEIRPDCSSALGLNYKTLYRAGLIPAPLTASESSMVNSEPAMLLCYNRVPVTDADLVIPVFAPQGAVSTSPGFDCSDANQIRNAVDFARTHPQIGSVTISNFKAWAVNCKQGLASILKDMQVAKN